LKTYNPGIEHGFCLICGKYPCNGIGDGMNIPDHEPDYDSVSVGDSISYNCDICGKPIQSQDLISLIINCRGEDHDFLDIDYCLDCTESKIIPLLQPERRKILEDTIKKLRDPYNPNQEDYEEY
jgi:hypothetical protein